jgi:disulfide bond formation protein DsbB
MALVMAATAFTGAWIAAYQTWLQRFAKGVSCTADQPWWEHFVNWAGSQWPLLFEASGLCSEAGWKFLGLSIAEWSLVAFTSMTIAMLATCCARTRKLIDDEESGKSRTSGTEREHQPPCSTIHACFATATIT